MTRPPRRVLMAFLLLGVIVSAPGSFFAGWGYHLRPPFGWIGIHLLSFGMGILLLLQLARPILTRVGSRVVLTVSAVSASLVLLQLAEVGGGDAYVRRSALLAVLGMSSGGLMAATFRLLQPIYEQSPGATMNLAGGLMGLGCFCPALIGWFCYEYADFRLALYTEAGMAAAMAWIFIRIPVRSEPPLPDLGFREILRELQSPIHVLFAALLFFQTAAEFSVAQWTALHLTLRSGMSPATAMFYLAVYFLLLWLGRFLAQGLLTRWPHRRILLVSAGLAWFGLLVLSGADNHTGAVIGLVLTAAGYSAIYPLLVERIGDRFAEYHASLFHGIFGVGMMGGFLAPALGGYLGMAWGEIQTMLVPLAASFLVFLLLAMIWIEAKISGLRVPRS